MVELHKPKCAVHTPATNEIDETSISLQTPAPSSSAIRISRVAAESSRRITREYAQIAQDARRQVLNTVLDVPRSEVLYDVPNSPTTLAKPDGRTKSIPKSSLSSKNTVEPAFENDSAGIIEKFASVGVSKPRHKNSADQAYLSKLNALKPPTPEE
jgi:hypothetical protein